jgi:hypothetical protein
VRFDSFHRQNVRYRDGLTGLSCQRKLYAIFSLLLIAVRRYSDGANLELDTYIIEYHKRTFFMGRGMNRVSNGLCVPLPNTGSVDSNDASKMVFGV